MLSTTCEETTVWVAILSSTACIFYISQSYEKTVSTKERVFISLVGPSGSEKSHFIFDWLKIDTFQPAFDKNF